MSPEEKLHLLTKAAAMPSAPEPTLVHAPSGLTLIRSVSHEEILLSETPSPAVTLFTHRFDPGPRPTSIGCSILIHCVAVAIVGS